MNAHIAMTSARSIVGGIAARGVLAVSAVLVLAGAVRLLNAPGSDGAIAAVVLVAALLSSVAGFAFAALAGSALAYLRLDPVQAVMTMALCSIAIQAYAVWQLHASIRWRALAPMLVAGVITTPIGVALLLRVDTRTFAALLGIIVTVYGGYALLRRQTRVVRATVWRDALAGAAGGLVGGLSSAPGLLMTVWCSLRGGDKVDQRAIYQPFILAMQVVTVACIGWAKTPLANAVGDAGFVPFALLGAIGGFALYQRMNTRQFQFALGGLLIVAGAGLLLRAL